MRERAVYAIEYLVFIAVIVVVWAKAVDILHINVLVLPHPSVVLGQFTQFWRLILGETLLTLTEALLGFSLALVVGLLMGLAMTYIGLFRRLVLPTLAALNATPLAVVAPIFVIWLSRDVPSKIALSFLISFFPIVINSSRGLSDVEPELLDVYRLIRASGWQIFWKLRLPSSLPALFDGMKLSLPIAVIGAVIGEFVASKKGIGYQILVAYSNFNTAFVFAAVIVVALSSTLLFQLLRLLERYLLRWREVRR